MAWTPKTFTFELCLPQIIVTLEDIQYLPKLYPYNVWDYTDLGEQTRAYVRDTLSHRMPGYLEVAGVSAHNGRGKQWGLILTHYPSSKDWSIVAQFGHTSMWRVFWPLRLALARRMTWCDYTNDEFKQPQLIDNLSRP